MKGFKVTRRFRDAKYEIDVRNPHGVESGVSGVTIDGVDAYIECFGNKCRGVRIPQLKKGTHKIVVTMG